LVKKAELDFIYQTATPLIYPEAYGLLRDFVPPGERGDLISAYRKRIMSSDDAECARKAAQLWCEWEDAISQLYPRPYAPWSGSGGEQRIHLHYMWHRGFFTYDGWLLDEAAKIHAQGIPTVIVHGRYDVVCPPASAYELSLALPDAKLVMVPDSGHSGWEPGTTRALVEATDSLKPR